MFRYRVIRTVLKVVQVVLSDLTVEGLEHLPASGPYVVAVNHVSVADSPILLLSFPVQRWRYFAGEKWESHWLFGPIMGWLGAIFIDRERVDRRQVRQAIEALKEGAVFGLAPEGRRSRSGVLQEAKNGAAFLALRAGVPVVPVGLSNTDVLFGNARRLRRTRLTVRIGPVVHLPASDRSVRARAMQAYTEYIMVHIAALLPPRYHGFYGRSPALAVLQAGEDPWPHCLAAAGDREMA